MNKYYSNLLSIKIINVKFDTRFLTAVSCHRQFNMADLSACAERRKHVNTFRVRCT